MQCELLGVAAREQVAPLIEVLIGLSGGPGLHIRQRELVVKSQASPFSELHLVQHTPDAAVPSNDRFVDTHMFGCCVEL